MVMVEGTLEGHDRWGWVVVEIVEGGLSSRGGGGGFGGSGGRG